MAPPVAVSSEIEESPILLLKKNLAQSNGNDAQFEVKENYDGDYRFAPIEEAQVSRAMIKRYVHNHHSLDQRNGQIDECVGTST